MAPLKKFMLLAGLVASCLCNGAMAAYLDLTDNSTISSLTAITDGFSGSVDGVGFTLISTYGLNFNESYDGSSNLSCQAGGGPLKCDNDGAGLTNDEITGLSESTGQTLSLSFDTAVYISSFDFLDLYLNPVTSMGGEQARVDIDGTIFTVDAIGTSGDGGYARLDLGGPILGQIITFTAYQNDLPQGILIQDDGDNDYAFAAITVSAVPIPAAVWLFGSAMIGFVSMSRKTAV